MNFSPSFALNCAGIIAAVLIAGCGDSDGRREFELGKSAYEANDLKGAEKYLEQSLKAAPDNIDAAICLANVKAELDELSAAKGLIDKASLRDPNASDIILLRAQIEYLAKDFASAIKDFTIIAENTGLSPELRAQGYSGIGVVEMCCGNPHIARIAFLSALRLDRRSAPAWYHLGMLYRDEFGFLEIAKDHFDAFVRIDELASPRVQQVQKKVIPALVDAISRAMMARKGADNRNSAKCASALVKAEAAWKKGQYKTARQQYEAALKEDALSYPAALGLAKAWEKTDSSKSGQAKALENYRLACALRPSDASILITAGALAAKLNFHSVSSDLYSRALAAKPNSLDAIDGLIRALRKEGGKNNIANAYQRYRDSLPKRKSASTNKK